MPMMPSPASGAGMPQGHTPAAMAPGNSGVSAAAIAKVREAIKVLSLALPELPVGSAIQQSVSKAITAISKDAPESEAAPGIQQSMMRDLIQQAQQQQQMQALQRAQPPAGGAAPQPQPQQ